MKTTKNNTANAAMDAAANAAAKAANAAARARAAAEKGDARAAALAARADKAMNAAKAAATRAADKAAKADAAANAAMDAAAFAAIQIEAENMDAATKAAALSAAADMGKSRKARDLSNFYAMRAAVKCVNAIVCNGDTGKAASHVLKDCEANGDTQGKNLFLRCLSSITGGVVDTTKNGKAAKGFDANAAAVKLYPYGKGRNAFTLIEARNVDKAGVKADMDAALAPFTDSTGRADYARAAAYFKGLPVANKPLMLDDISKVAKALQARANKADANAAAFIKAALNLSLQYGAKF